jgi:Fe2+ or Zn2+ uptake regulation protein
MSEARFLALIEVLRTKGRVTTARRALLGALADSDHHRTAEDLADEVRAAYPTVHRATIYRSLDAMTEMGLIEHTHLGHGPAVYHLAEGAHHHLVCEACGAVIEVPSALFDDLSRSISHDYGFEVTSRHFAVIGRCRACVALPAGRTGQ